MIHATIPGFAQLEAMPAILSALLAGCSDADARSKPAPDRWSILEVLGHLAHVEAHGFRGRAEVILREDNPRFENYDPDALLSTGAYAQPGLKEALQAFEAERRQSLVLLARLQPGDFARTGVHGALGPVTLSNLLHEWPFHDLGHLRQITELLRALRFYPGMGPWQQFYAVRP